MTVLETVTLAVVAVVLLGWYLSYTAARLHRLHTRVEGALAALDAQLVRRADTAVELANSGVLDPATSLLLADAAIDCLDFSAEEMTSGDWAEGNLAQREELESSLSQTIRLSIGSGRLGSELLASDRLASDRLASDRLASDRSGPGESEPAGSEADDPAEALVARLRDAGRRVQLARRFYNDGGSDVRRLRGHPVVATFHLAGHAALPRSADFDDGSPDSSGSSGSDGAAGSADSLGSRGASPRSDGAASAGGSVGSPGSIGAALD